MKTFLENNRLIGAHTTTVSDMNQLGRLLCTHSLDSLIGFSLCIIICIYLLEFGEFQLTKTFHHLQVL